MSLTSFLVSIFLIICSNQLDYSSGFFFNLNNLISSSSTSNNNGKNYNFFDSSSDSFSSPFSNPRSSRSSSSPSRHSESNEDDPGDGDGGANENMKCFGELGCIENTANFFHPIYRPFNLLPNDRDKVHTRFILYHRQRMVDPIQVFLDGPNLLEEGFDPFKPTKIISHGFLDSGYSFWVTKLAQALLLAGDFNVLVVDWAGGSLSLYTQATANTRLVALEIANYIKFLQREVGVKLEDVHCIGHSLGAHVCGYTGQHAPGLGRITGLDPAEPYFQYMPEQVRLSPDDAKFIDVVHTDGRTILLLGLGMIQPCGHMDFYPNAGQDQPGCDLKDLAVQGSILHSHGYEELERDLFACNHHRAIYYWTEAVLNRCQFVGHLCDAWDTYLKGECWSCGSDGSNCALMGLDADKYKIGNRSFVPFYVSTAKSAPFCVRHYRMSIQLARPRQAAEWVEGKLKLSIFGTKSYVRDINLTPNANIRLQHGSMMSFMIQNAKQLGIVERVTLTWKQDRGAFFGFKSYFGSGNLFVTRVQVIDMDNLDPAKSAEVLSRTLCGEEGTKHTEIISGSSVKFGRSCSE